MQADPRDLSDRVWKLLEPHLPGRRGTWGGKARDNRLFINAVLWVLRTGAPWRDLPPEYGDWKNTNRRFCRWRDKGIWEKPLETLILEPECEWLLLDAGRIEIPAHAAGAKGGNRDTARARGGSRQKFLWPWMRMVCRSEDLLLKAQQRIAPKLADLLRE